MFISLNVDTCFEVCNFGYGDNIDISKRIEYYVVRNRGADIRNDNPLGWVYESAYLYYLFINCNSLSGF